MDCRRIQPALTEAAVRGEPEARLAGHIETCASCAAELHRLRTAMLRLERQLEAELAVEVPPELYVHDWPRFRRATGWLYLRASAAGLAAVLVVVFVILVARSVEPIRAPESTAVEVERPPAPVPRTGEREASIIVAAPSRAPSPAPPVSTTEPRVLVPRDRRPILSPKRSPGPSLKRPDYRFHRSTRFRSR